MSMIVNGVDIPKNCAECPAGTYEYNDNDERCFVCGFIKSQHPWECEHVEIDGIDTTKIRADFCPLISIPTPHGRLIDADVPLEKVSKMMQEPDYQHEGENWMVGLIMARDAIDETKTIIKAED